MKSLLILVLLALADSTPSTARDGKVLSLFNLVTFDNLECTSTARVRGQARRGTCFTADECNSNGGRPQGKCASGFGVCCVFSVSSGRASLNNTYIQNEGFPNNLEGTDAANVVISKCSPDVCFLRLDFEAFNTLGPALTDENLGGQCRDTLTITSPNQPTNTIPVICGYMTGQHIYVDIGNQPADAVTLNFATNGANSNERQWDIRATQIECNSPSRPDPGCLQWLTGFSGTISSFNFNNPTLATHLANQDYTICIRPEGNADCIRYTTCSDDLDNFSLNNEEMGSATQREGRIDSECDSDYVLIEGAQSVCTTGPADMTSRICGTQFSAVEGMFTNNVGSNIFVCDCTRPFRITVNTDAAMETNSDTQSNRGFCLRYTQLS